MTRLALFLLRRAGWTVRGTEIAWSPNGVGVDRAFCTVAQSPYRKTPA